MNYARTFFGSPLLVLAAAVSCAIAVAACYQKPDDGAGAAPSGAVSPSATSLDGTTCVASAKDDEVRLALTATCASCHGEGSNRPFFASLRSFETLLVGNPALVAPGKPDASRLVALLEGNGGGSFPQMPPTEAFAALERDGKTKITIAQIRDWIAQIGAAVPEDPTPDRAAPTMRRATAEEMYASLLAQLGLDPDTDLGPASTLPLMATDAPAEFSLGDYTAVTRARGAWARFVQLGGPNTIHGQPRQSTVTTAAIQVLTNVSQEWCSLAVAKPGSVLLKYATLSDTSQSAAPAVKKNIRYLFLHMLGVVATDADVDKMFSDVFVKLEPKGAHVAWTGVCSAFVRRPEWMLL